MWNGRRPHSLNSQCLHGDPDVKNEEGLGPELAILNHWGGVVAGLHELSLCPPSIAEFIFRRNLKKKNEQEK